MSAPKEKNLAKPHKTPVLMQPTRRGARFGGPSFAPAPTPAAPVVAAAKAHKPGSTKLTAAATPATPATAQAQAMLEAA